MGKYQFIEFVGGCFLNGKAVAAYRVDSDTIQLRAETTGGKIISRVRNVSISEFDALKAAWSCGSTSNQDAGTVYRGLIHLGSI